MVHRPPPGDDTAQPHAGDAVTGSRYALSQLSDPHGSPRREGLGVALALLSAAAFGLFAVLIRIAGDEGASSVSVMAGRFLIAAPVLWIVASAGRASRGDRIRGRLSLRPALGGIGLGFVGYATQAALFQGAVNRTGAALADLLLYAYPALVVIVAWAIGRESPDRRRLVTLGIASLGVVLVLMGGGGSEFDGIGVMLGLGAALAYTLYILGCDVVVRGVTPFQLAALVSTGAGTAFVLAGAAGIGGGLDFGFTARAWLAVAGIALVGTVLAVSAFLASLELIGPSRSSILSTLEPVVTVILAYVILDERLGPVQLLGGGLVLAACVLLQLRRQTGPASPDLQPVGSERAAGSP